MNGSQTKALRRELLAAGVKLTPSGWRRVKRGWSNLSREEREGTTALDIVEDLKAQDQKRLEARLKRLPRKRLEKLYRSVTTKKT